MLAWMGGVKRRIEKSRKLPHPSALKQVKAIEAAPKPDAARGAKQDASEAIASLRSLDTSFLVALVAEKTAEPTTEKGEEAGGEEEGGAQADNRRA
ncbi:hypothetical protein HKI87_10g61640 [Chloropicon roscoffensis]|uniref:Uncharacterized protein n=1 Tax=Chloropicon roscoffensis TaxID=1461544 RepID=A0AAX4PF32_9CHLO